MRIEIGDDTAITGHVDASCSVEAKERHLIGHGQAFITATSLLVSWFEHAAPAGAQCVQDADRARDQNDTPSGGVSGQGCCGHDRAKTGCAGHFLKKAV